MSKIAYDPVKDRFARLIRNSSLLRTLFYNLLDLFFLRSWYVRDVVRERARDLERQGKWTLLDAGCGFGQYDRFLLRTFPNVSVHATDVKENYLADCRRYFRKEVSAGRIAFEVRDLREPAPGWEESFNFVVCIDVLEHIHEDERVIGNIARELAPGGWFLMHSPSCYSEDDADGEDSFVREHARTGYSREEISEKLKRVGLDPVEVAYTYGKRGHLAWVMLIKGPMLLLNRIGLAALPLLLIYYAVTLLPGLVLMKLDMATENERGTGIYALAKKPLA